jgi:hypothetical protein
VLVGVGYFYYDAVVYNEPAFAICSTVGGTFDIQVFYRASGGSDVICIFIIDLGTLETIPVYLLGGSGYISGEIELMPDVTYLLCFISYEYAEYTCTISLT